MEHHKVFTFGREFGVPFELEIRASSDGRRVLTLSHGPEVVKGLSKQALELLQVLLEHPRKDCDRDTILYAISPDSDDNLVDRYISYLRTALSSDPSDKSKFIETIEGGYRFRLEVEEKGDLGSMNAYPEWDPLRFHELLRDLKRSPDGEEDLRIVTTGISPSLEVLDIKGLLRRHLRIKVLFMNPANEGLTESRYSLRKDRTAARCLRELREQIADIEEYAKQNRPNDSNLHSGSIDYGLSDAMPCGFVVHTRGWALLGIFLAHSSYTSGPMVEIHAGTEAWEQLHLDWKARWNACTERRTVKELRRS